MRGDHDAFGALIGASANRLYALASLILRDTDRAQDATQEAIVRAWRELPRLRDPERFEAWLRRMVVNACYDEGRRTRRRAEVSLVHLAEHQMVDPTVRFAESERIDHAFRRLPLDQRTTLVLQHQFGMSHIEIAETLGLPGRDRQIEDPVRHRGDAGGARGGRSSRLAARWGANGMTRERSDLDFAAMLDGWMNEVAPAAMPVRSWRRRSPGRCPPARCACTRGSGSCDGLPVLEASPDSRWQRPPRCSSPSLSSVRSVVVSE